MKLRTLFVGASLLALVGCANKGADNTIGQQQVQIVPTTTLWPLCSVLQPEAAAGNGGAKFWLGVISNVCINPVGGLGAQEAIGKACASTGYPGPGMTPNVCLPPIQVNATVSK